MKVENEVLETPETRKHAATAGLARLLADTEVLALKARSSHWNVRGPWFPMLHEWYEGQYRELAGAADRIAERIRALGHIAPGSYGEFAQLATVPDTCGAPEAREMLGRLLEGHEIAINTATWVIPAAQAAGDEVTSDLIVQRMQAHQQAAWMLRSMLAD